MRTKFCFLAVLLFTICTSATAQKKNKRLPAQFKVVGYYFLHAAMRDTTHADSNYLFLNKLTHLNIAFINPDTTGHFNEQLAIDTLIKKAHNKNVKVLASIGGGGSHAYYAALLKDDKRKMLVNNLTALVQRYQLDGIDVDLEGSDIDANYEKLVTELAASLKPLKKIITAAIATVYKEQLPDKALQQFDFVNIMSYDNTGPWNPKRPGHHSPYEMAVKDLEYWHKLRKIPKEKLVLGVPFYGYGFGASDSAVVTMTYKQIAAIANRNASDTIKLPGNIVMYYNNIATIKRKTELAMQKAGGVMIWQLLGDTKDQHSLLNTIHQVLHKSKKR